MAILCTTHLFTRGCLLTGNRLLTTLAGTRVGLCALTADRESTTVTQTAIATDIHQSLDTQRNLSAELTLYRVIILNDAANFLRLILRPGGWMRVGIKSHTPADLDCS